MQHTTQAMNKAFETFVQPRELAPGEMAVHADQIAKALAGDKVAFKTAYSRAIELKKMADKLYDTMKHTAAHQMALAPDPIDPVAVDTAIRESRD